jgi:hypothetical protein
MSAEFTCNCGASLSAGSWTHLGIALDSHMRTCKKPAYAVHLFSSRPHFTEVQLQPIQIKTVYVSNVPPEIVYIPTKLNKLNTLRACRQFYLDHIEDMLEIGSRDLEWWYELEMNKSAIRMLTNMIDKIIDQKHWHTKKPVAL